MDGDLILTSLIFLFILFIFFVPPLLYRGLKKAADPVPLYLPVVLSAFVIGVLACIGNLPIISEDNVVAGTIAAFLLLLLFVDFAVIAPYPIFERKIGVIATWKVFPLPAFVGTFLLFYMTAGEAYVGRPMPPFSAPLPLTGWILDGTASALNLQGVVYAFGSPVYEMLREIGLWLEVIIVAIAYYWVLSVLPKPGLAEK